MDAIRLLPRTGTKWEALDATELCSHSSFHRRFREWTGAGVFERSWHDRLLARKPPDKADLNLLALDGTMTKVPPVEEHRRELSRSRQKGHQA